MSRLKDSSGNSSERSPLLSASQHHTLYDRSNGEDSGTPTSLSPGHQHAPTRSLTLLCIAVWVPVLIAAADSTIVATMIGSVSSSFNASEQASWLGTSYLLSVCCFTPIYGRLCDVLGRRYAMLLALSFFTIGTLMCGISTSMEMLIASRALAGIGGGGITTCTSTVLSDVIPLRNRGLYQGLTNIIFGLGSGLGGPLGGFLTDTWGWKNAFLVQIPVLLLSIILCTLFVHGDPPESQSSTMSNGTTPTAMDRLKSIDFLGSLTLVGCVGPILLSLSFISANDMSIKDGLVWGCFLGGTLSGIAFIYVEKFVAKSPVLPLRVAAQRTGGSVAIANLFLSITSFVILYNYPLYFQATRLNSSSQAGLHLIPNSVGLALGSVLAGLWMRLTGFYYKYNFSNSLLLVLTSVWLVILTPRTTEWITYVAVVPSGFGLSTVLTCTLVALINSVPRSDIAVATGMSYLFRTTGQVLGVSASGAILQAVLKKELRKRINDEDVISSIRHQSSAILNLPEDLKRSAIESYEIALRYVFVFALCSAIATTLSCYFIEDIKLPEPGKAQQESNTEENGEAHS